MIFNLVKRAKDLFFDGNKIGKDDTNVQDAIESVYEETVVNRDLYEDLNTRTNSKFASIDSEIAMVNLTIESETVDLNNRMVDITNTIGESIAAVEENVNVVKTEKLTSTIGTGGEIKIGKVGNVKEISIALSGVTLAKGNWVDVAQIEEAGDDFLPLLGTPDWCTNINRTTSGMFQITSNGILQMYSNSDLESISIISTLVYI